MKKEKAIYRIDRLVHEKLIIEGNEEKLKNKLIHYSYTSYDLYKQKIQSIIIEGGAHTLSGFIDSNLWDEARTFVSSKTFNKGIQAPMLHGSLVSEEFIVNDILKIHHPKQKC